MDKFLTDIQLEFRNRYKNDLHHFNVSRNYSGFRDVFLQMIKAAEDEARVLAKAPKYIPFLITVSYFMTCRL